MNPYIASTFQPATSQDYDTSTIKRISPFTPWEEGTDRNSTSSIFALPIEDLEKIEMRSEDAGVKINDHKIK